MFAKFPGNAPTSTYKECLKYVYHVGKADAVFLGKFKNRLDDMLLEDSLDYIKHGEYGLAFDIFCNHLSECDVFVSEADLNEAINIASIMKYEPDASVLECLRRLVR